MTARLHLEGGDGYYSAVTSTRSLSREKNLRIADVTQKLRVARVFGSRCL